MARLRFPRIVSVPSTTGLGVTMFILLTALIAASLHVGSLPANALEKATPTLPAVPIIPSASQGPAGSFPSDNPRLNSLAAAVEDANLAVNASTMWRGGMLGAQEALEVALTVGEKMPAFGLETLNGDVFQLDLIGQPMLINFWAAWCAPCQEEFPVLIAADRADLPFDVAFVNVWDEPSSYGAFLENYPSDIRVMIDSAGILPSQYHLGFVPVTVLVDEAGIVHLIQRGRISQAVIDLAAALSAR